MATNQGPLMQSQSSGSTDPIGVGPYTATNFWQEHKAHEDNLASLWLEFKKDDTGDKVWAAWDNAPAGVQNSVIQAFMSDSQEIKVWVKHQPAKDRYKIVGLVQCSTF